MIDFFTCVQRWLKATPAGEVLTISLRTWEDEGVWIAGYTKASPRENLMAWAAAQGHHVIFDPEQYSIRITQAIPN